MEYVAWAWDLIDGMTVEDSGLRSGERCSEAIETTASLDSLQFPTAGYPSSESLSKKATRKSFGWLRTDGYPVAERGIYRHPWLDMEESDDEQESATLSSEHEANRVAANNPDVQSWLSQLDTCDQMNDLYPAIPESRPILVGQILVFLKPVWTTARMLSIFLTNSMIIRAMRTSLASFPLHFAPALFAFMFIVLIVGMLASFVLTESRRPGIGTHFA